MLNPIIGGIFGTQTQWDENGNVTVKDEFHLRLYKDLWESGAIQKLKGNMLHVYLTISLHLDNKGEGWPTQERISEMCGINRNTAGTAIKKLVKEGFIEAEKVRTTGRFDNSVYKIKFAPRTENPQDEGVSTMPKKSSWKNHHGKLGTKKELGFKKDPIFKKDIKQQQETKKRVVGIREKYESLFQSKLTKKQAEDLLALATKMDVDIIQKIQNTYEMHRVEPRRSIVASIKRAITHGDWEMNSSKVVVPLPKAVEMQRNGEKAPSEYTPEELAKMKEEVERKIAMMYKDDGVLSDEE